MAVQVWRQERCQRLSSWVDSDEVGAAAAVEGEHASLALSAAAIFQIKMLPSPFWNRMKSLNRHQKRLKVQQRSGKVETKMALCVSQNGLFRLRYGALAWLGCNSPLIHLSLRVYLRLELYLLCQRWVLDLNLLYLTYMKGNGCLTMASRRCLSESGEIQTQALLAVKIGLVSCQVLPQICACVSAAFPQSVGMERIQHPPLPRMN